MIYVRDMDGWPPFSTGQHRVAMKRMIDNPITGEMGADWACLCGHQYQARFRLTPNKKMPQQIKEAINSMMGDHHCGMRAEFV